MLDGLPPQVFHCATGHDDAGIALLSLRVSLRVHEGDLCFPQLRDRLHRVKMRFQRMISIPMVVGVPPQVYRCATRHGLGLRCANRPRLSWRPQVEREEKLVVLGLVFRAYRDLSASSGVVEGQESRLELKCVAKQSNAAKQCQCTASPKLRNKYRFEQPYSVPPRDDC